MKATDDITARAMLLGGEWSELLDLIVVPSKNRNGVALNNRYFTKYGVELDGKETATQWLAQIRAEEAEANARRSGDVARR